MAASRTACFISAVQSVKRISEQKSNVDLVSSGEVERSLCVGSASCSVEMERVEDGVNVAVERAQVEL